MYPRLPFPPLFDDFIPVQSYLTKEYNGNRYNNIYSHVIATYPENFTSKKKKRFLFYLFIPIQPPQTWYLLRTFQARSLGRGWGRPGALFLAANILNLHFKKNNYHGVGPHFFGACENKDFNSKIEVIDIRTSPYPIFLKLFFSHSYSP